MIPIVMPKLGLTMTEGTIQEWLKSEGDHIRQGDPVVEIETDKSTASVEAPGEGTLWGIQFPEVGTAVEVGTPIAYLLAEGEQPPTGLSPVGPAAQVPSDSVPATITVSAPAAAATDVKSSPAARALAKQLGLDLKSISPDAKGVIHLAQVEAAKAALTAEPKATPLARELAREQGIDLRSLSAPEGGRIYAAQVSAAAAPAQTAVVQAADEEIPFQGIRKTVAKRMAQSKREVPHFYLSLRADMTRAKALMARQKEKVSLHDLLIRVLAQALGEHPEVNVHVYEDRIVRKREISIGVAVATDKGLIVPVVRDVAGKSLTAIAHESRELVRKARDGSLTPDEYQGGTFTISNLGMYGIETFAAIINQPEAALLAVGRMVDELFLEEGEVKTRPMLTLTASYDHRAIDGVDGAKFLSRLKELLEDPELLI